MDPTPPTASIRTPAVSRPSLLAIVVLFMVAALFQLVNPMIADVSWLFVVDEKILAGARVYVDVIEANPPMSLFLYMPAVLIEHLTGIAAETVEVVLTLGSIAASLALCGSILRRGEHGRVARFILMGALVFAVLPMFVFAEREHFAVVFMLPALLVLATHAEGGGSARWTRVVAGIAAGLAICIKPHFALALLVPALVLAIRAGSVLPLLLTQHWIAGAIAVLYAAIVFVFFRVYLTDILPLLSDTYRAFNFSLIDLLLNPAFLITAGIGAASVVVLGREALKPRVLVLLLAAAGFSVAFVEQGKGWVYHLYPAIALVTLVFLTDALPPIIARLTAKGRMSPRSLAVVLVGAGALIGIVHLEAEMKERNTSSIALVDRVRAMIDHPRVLTISADLSIGHPFTRMVGGTWVGTFGCQFVSTTATMLERTPGLSPERLERLEAYIARDREILAHDLRVGAPDIVLVHPKTFPWDELMASDTDAARLLRGYTQIASLNGLLVLVPASRLAELAAKGRLSP